MSDRLSVLTRQVSGQQRQLVGRQWDLLRGADGVPPAAAAGERLQGADRLAASPQQQAGLLRLLLLHQVLGVGAAQSLEVRGQSKKQKQKSGGLVKKKALNMAARPKRQHQKAPCGGRRRRRTASEPRCAACAPSPAAEPRGSVPLLKGKHRMSRAGRRLRPEVRGGGAYGRLTALAEVLQGLPVALQVLVDGVALVVGLQALQHVEEGEVLFGVLDGNSE